MGASISTFHVGEESTEPLTSGTSGSPSEGQLERSIETLLEMTSGGWMDLVLAIASDITALGSDLVM